MMLYRSVNSVKEVDMTLNISVCTETVSLRKVLSIILPMDICNVHFQDYGSMRLISSIFSYALVS